MSTTKIKRFVVGDAVTVWAGPRMGVPLERRSVVKATREGYQLDNGSEWVDRDGLGEVARPSAFRLGSSGKRGGLLLRTDVRAETEALLKGIDWSTVGDKALAEVVSALTRGGRWPLNLPFSGAGEAAQLSPPPREGETLSEWRTRAGSSGSDTPAARSVVWKAGRWSRAESAPKTLGEVCSVLHGFGLHAPCRPSDYVSEDGTYVASLRIYEGDLPGLMRAIGPGWVYQEVKRETVNGLLSGMMLLVNIRPTPETSAKTLAEICDALNNLQIHRDHNYRMSRDGEGLTHLRVHETALPTITEVIGAGWTITETARQPAVGDVGMSLLLDVRPAASTPPAPPKTLDDVCATLATFQLDAGHDYYLSTERHHLVRLRMDEAVVPQVTAAVGPGWTFEQIGRHETGDGRYVVLFNVIPEAMSGVALGGLAYRPLVPGQKAHTVQTRPGPCRRRDCSFAHCTDEAHRLTGAMGKALATCLTAPYPTAGLSPMAVTALDALGLITIRKQDHLAQAVATPFGREVYARWKAPPARPKARKGAR